MHGWLFAAVILISSATVAGSIFLIGCAAWSRFRTMRDARQLGVFLKHLQQAFATQTDSRVGYESALAGMRNAIKPRLSPAMEQSLLDTARSLGSLEFARRVSDDLGFLERWRSALRVPAAENGNAHRGYRRRADYTVRARCAACLGAIGDRASWRLLAGALEDSHPDVQRAALRSLAELKNPEAASALIKLAVTSKPDGAISERSLRAAWSNLAPGCGASLLALFDSPAGRVRRLALEMAAQSLSARRNSRPRLTRDPEGAVIPASLLNRLAGDPDPEVRAKLADLLAEITTESGALVLRELLTDQEWFVRLHAVRAVAALRRSSDIEWVAPLLTDSSWHVREAAAECLSRWGRAGLDRLVATYQTTPDTYARDQIAEILEESGRADLLRGMLNESLLEQAAPGELATSPGGRD